jgi:hypothetical protein
MMQTQLETTARRRRWMPIAATAAGVAAVAVGVVLAMDRVNPQAAGDTVELRLPDTGGDVFASCLPFTADYLADMSPAFAGTVTQVTGNRAVISVDRWYAGGSAAEVVVEAPEDAHIALNGVIDFQEGKRYLITAEGNLVNLCGYSGEATPEMEAVFEAAF